LAAYFFLVCGLYASGVVGAGVNLLISIAPSVLRVASIAADVPMPVTKPARFASASVNGLPNAF